MVGKQVQQYTFLEKLGAGGMGDIYRAQDTRLNRFVAIKVLAGSASGDPERRRRFIQEAQAASALNHPNIITIHDIITEGDAQYMVMEHVQGKTLGDMIPKGGLRVPQVLKLAMQMTDALQTAHSAGIIHRDLKPGNVMVTDTGLVKVLDFGLAKLTDPAPVTQGEADATKTMGPAPLTVEGSIIGTVSYMSPEQAQGKKVDTRSDIFSFGVVLYEMITGARAFQADTTVGTLSAILRDDARPIAEIAPDVPPKLEQVVTRSLMKNPDDRFQTMKDMHHALGALKHESDSGVLYRSMVMTPSEIQKTGGKPASASKITPPAAPEAKSKTPMIAAAAVGAVVIGGIIWSQMGGQPAPPPAPAPKAEPVAAAPAPAPVPDATLTNQGIIDMVKAKVPIEVIYSQLRNAPKNFDLSASAIIKLTSEGVSPAIIDGMRDPKTIPAAKAAATLPVQAKSNDKSVPATPVAPTATPAKQEPVAATPSAPPPPPAAVAEVVTPRPAPPAPGGKQVVLADGSPFPISLTADLPENAKEGVQLRFAVVNDVHVGDVVVIAKGAVATGQITQTKGRLMGKMQLRLLTVTAVDGKVYKIRALSARSNKNQERPVDTGVKPRGDKVAADAGTQYIAYVDGDMNVTLPRGR